MTKAMKNALARTLTAGCHGLAVCAIPTAQALERRGLVTDGGEAERDAVYVRLTPAGFAVALPLAAAAVAADPHEGGYGLRGLAETLTQLYEDKFLQD